MRVFEDTENGEKRVLTDMSVGRILGVVQKRIFGKEIFPCGPTVEKFCFTNTKTKRNTFFYWKDNSKISKYKTQGVQLPVQHAQRIVREISTCFSSSAKTGLREACIDNLIIYKQLSPSRCVQCVLLRNTQH